MNSWWIGINERITEYSMMFKKQSKFFLFLWAFVHIVLLPWIQLNLDNSNTINIGIADYFSYAHWNPYRIKNTVSPQRMSSDLTSWATGLPFFCPDPTVQYKTCVWAQRKIDIDIGMLHANLAQLPTYFSLKYVGILKTSQVNVRKKFCG